MGSVLGVIFVVSGLASYAAAVSIVNAGIVGWLEFTGVGAKLQRYSSAVGALTELGDWWAALTPMEQSLTENADRLVATAEAVIRSEQESWAAIAASAAKASGDGGGQEIKDKK
jgi:hypothetical protein